MYHPVTTTIRYKCPQCQREVTHLLEVPEVDYSYDRLSDSLSEDDGDIECPYCQTEFAVHIQNSPSHCAVEFIDFPDVKVDADDAFYSGYEDDDFDVDVKNQKEPVADLLARLISINKILSLSGPPDAVLLATQLAYSSVITALETYLWETMKYAIENDEKIVFNIITKFPHFKDQKMDLRKIYDRFEGLKAEVNRYLQDTVWHKWEAVGSLFKHGLGINAPSFGVFFDAIKKRHDIVHRSGHTKDGEPIIISSLEVQELTNHVIAFANELEGMIAQRQLGNSHDI